jgi:hypothetical protein
MPAAAQTAGEGSLEGTVTDSTGAVVPHASITITNNATGIKTVSEASSAGYFDIAPVQPGTYTVEVTAKGFKNLIQDNVVVDALQVRAISPRLEIGAETQTVTVTAAPPVLDTADAALGLTVENDTYSHRLRYPHSRLAGRSLGPHPDHRWHWQLPRSALPRRHARHHRQSAGRQSRRLPLHEH